MKIETQNKSSTQNTNHPQNINSTIEQLITDILQRYLSQPQKAQQPQQTLQQNDNNIIRVKAGMKASVISLKIENLLLQGKNVVTLESLGFAIPIMLDTILLVRKDLQKQGRDVKISSLEVFEQTVTTNNKKKTISGLRAVISLNKN